MKLNSSIIDMVRTMRAKIFYQDSGHNQILFGYILKQTEDSFIIKKADGFENNVVLPKKWATMILWPKDMSTTPTKTSTRPLFEKKKKRARNFSYARWWKDHEVQEAEP